CGRWRALESRCIMSSIWRDSSQLAERLVYRFHESARIGGFPLGLTISISAFGGLADGEMVMAAPRRVIEVSFSEKELSDLACVSRSRTEPANHVQRACILLTYREKPSLYATGRAIGVTHQTV